MVTAWCADCESEYLLLRECTVAEWLDHHSVLCPAQPMPPSLGRLLTFERDTGPMGFRPMRIQS